MPGFAEMALGAAPIFGGALLGVAAGQIRGPDFRGTIKADMELLKMIPEEESLRRAALQRTINQRIDDLVEANQKSRELREAASSYQGNWRDFVLVLCAVLFTIVWWNVPHSRANWLIMFVVMIVVSVVAALYAVRGIRKSIAAVLRRSHSGSADSNNR
jgi:ABC-type antimicrobial peptide transport system permease subunit